MSVQAAGGQGAVARVRDGRGAPWPLDDIAITKEHGNDLFYYSAVEPDSLIAVFRHFF